MKTRVFTSSLLSLMFVALTNLVQAQWTTASTNIHNSNTGNVGINNTNPLVKLAVDISSTTTTYNGYTGANVALMLKNQSNTANNFTVLSFANSGTNTIADITAINTSHTNHTGRLSFSTRAAGAGPQQRMLIDENGNVGIGTTTPGGKLEINTGTGSFDGLRLYKATDNDKNWISFWQGSGASGVFRLGQLQWSDGMALYVGGTNASSPGALIQKWNVNGNVGIGTENPDAKLTVKGTIHAQEVRVDLNGAVAPDYVFEKDYNLMPLDELKVYLEANKHLPEVPSAQAMDADGVNLKEMNLLLLKKVEELTLHVIELHTKNQQLEKKVNQLIHDQQKQ